MFLHHRPGDGELLHRCLRWQVVHQVQHQLLNDAAQGAGTGLAPVSLLGDRLDGVIGELQLHVVHAQQGAELLHQSIAGLGEDRLQGAFVQGLQHGAHRHPADEFGDQAVAHQIIRLQVPQHLGGLKVAVGAAASTAVAGHEADGIAAHAFLHHVVQTDEGTTADEQDLAGVDLDAVLIGVLAPALGRHVGHRALQHFQQGLLHTFAGHIPCDRGVLALAGDLVDFIDVDDPPLGLVHIHVGLLQQPQQDVFHVLTHVARFGEGGGIGHGEGHVQHFGQGLGQQRLAAAGGSDQQDVALVQPGCCFLGFALAIPLPGQTFVVVVDRHRHHLLGRVLADHLLIQEALDVLRPWNGGQGRGRFAALAGGWCGLPARLMAVAGVALPIHQLFIQDLVAEIDAFVADVNARSGDQLAHLVLGFPTERTLQMGVELGHRTLGTTQENNSGINRWGLPEHTGSRTEGRLSALRNDSSVPGTVHHAIDQAVFNRFCRRKEVVAVGVFRDLVERLAGVLRHQPVQGFLEVEDFLGLDLDVHRLPLGATKGLVNHDPGIRQGESLAFGASGEQEGTHAGGEAVADGHHVRGDLLHRVVDRQPSGDRPSRGVDVDLDVLFGILGFEEQHLRHQGIGDGVIHAGAEEDDPLPQQAGIDVEGAVAATGLFHNRGQWPRCRDGHGGPPAVLDGVVTAGVDHAIGMR